MPSCRLVASVRPMATIQDVARDAGVSTATVSRVFSAPELVLEATRARLGGGGASPAPAAATPAAAAPSAPVAATASAAPAESPKAEKKAERDARYAARKVRKAERRTMLERMW